MKNRDLAQYLRNSIAAKEMLLHSLQAECRAEEKHAKEANRQPDQFAYRCVYYTQMHIAELKRILEDVEV